MSTTAVLIAWLISAALTLFAGVVLLVAVALIYTIQDDRRLMDLPARGDRPEAGGQGRNQGGEVEGPASLHVFNGRKS